MERRFNVTSDRGDGTESTWVPPAVPFVVGCIGTIAVLQGGSMDWIRFGALVVPFFVMAAIMVVNFEWTKFRMRKWGSVTLTDHGPPVPGQIWTATLSFMSHQPQSTEPTEFEATCTMAFPGHPGASCTATGPRPLQISLTVPSTAGDPGNVRLRVRIKALKARRPWTGWADLGPVGPDPDDHSADDSEQVLEE